MGAELGIQKIIMDIVSNHEDENAKKHDSGPRYDSENEEDKEDVQSGVSNNVNNQEEVHHEESNYNNINNNNNNNSIENELDMGASIGIAILNADETQLALEAAAVVVGNEQQKLSGEEMSGIVLYDQLQTSYNSEQLVTGMLKNDGQLNVNQVKSQASKYIRQFG